MYFCFLRSLTSSKRVRSSSLTSMPDCTEGRAWEEEGARVRESGARARARCARERGPCVELPGPRWRRLLRVSRPGAPRASERDIHAPFWRAEGRERRNVTQKETIRLEVKFATTFSPPLSFFTRHQRSSHSHTTCAYVVATRGSTWGSRGRARSLQSPVRSRDLSLTLEFPPPPPISLPPLSPSPRRPRCTSPPSPPSRPFSRPAWRRPTGRRPSRPPGRPRRPSSTAPRPPSPRPSCSAAGTARPGPMPWSRLPVRGPPEGWSRPQACRGRERRDLDRAAPRV
jgi:hypothetical protein